jgi:hypothetical protein
VIPLRRPTDVVQFTPDAAERIGRAVLTLENAVPAGKPLAFDRVDTPRKLFRVCTFTGAWSKNSFKTVTLKYVTSTPNTFVATNLFAEIASPSGAKNCAIAKDGTAWHLIAAECD